MNARLFVFAAILALAACQPATKAPEAPVITAEQSAATAAELTAKGGTLTGTLTAADDAGYPMFWTKFALEGGASLEALLNAEDVNMKEDVPTELVGKKVTATLEATAEPSLLRLEDAKGKFVHEREVGPDQKLEIPADAQKVTGVLKGAKEPTGDLPGELTITASDGAVVTFREFFNEALAAQEGKTVTMTYDIHRSVKVTALAAAPDAAAK